MIPQVNLCLQQGLTRTKPGTLRHLRAVTDKGLRGDGLPPTGSK